MGSDLEEWESSEITEYERVMLSKLCLSKTDTAAVRRRRKRGELE